MDQITISSSSDSDSSMFTSTTRHPITFPNPSRPSMPTSNNPEKKSTTHQARSTIHTSNTILSSSELLLLHSLATNESVPRTRRRFQAQILEPDDVGRAWDIFWDDPSSSSAKRNISSNDKSGIKGGGVGGLQVPTNRFMNVIDVVETDDKNGWEKLRVQSKKSGTSSPRNRKTSSPAGGRKGGGQRVVSGSRDGIMYHTINQTN
ncbi:conserved hypothetical protein [Talaromyces stipitatus ATCC 10500]|uniref:Uncharacterized protein n=1 Tax=Talaromyces stipitatus (strain ATCC 10500 / CBS 375.48 / QM 6759 / NRRL 1006) TaxID=441959 RepID=B8MLL0_TALSN|nr:uncharacterized protein TSTA_049810 [Talaromyces stipitatus ATCC 10500]EED15543.1 conserved hypothetical protein [Talaromyces stipitatus ATCC 10500]